jgi:large conductance mechanosensitive channel
MSTSGPKGKARQAAVSCVADNRCLGLNNKCFGENIGYFPHIATALVVVVTKAKYLLLIPLGYSSELPVLLTISPFLPMSIISEFKEFISKGNVLDLAVGVIIGAAFGKIVSSLTDDILMPLLGLVVGKMDYSTITLGPMKIGLFINAVLNFFIIAFCIFLIVQGANKLKRPAPVVVVEPPAPVATKEEVLLTEIRDALRTRS